MRLVAGIRPFAKPKVRAAFEQLLKAAEEVERWSAHHATFHQRMAALGFPLSNGITAVAPYDFIADYFRGASGMMTDLFRHKDKLLAALDKAATFLIRQTIARRASLAAIRSCSSRSTGRPTPSCRRSSSRPSGGRRSAS